MKNYQFLLFDLDDTLLDFGAAEKWALPKLFAAHKFPLTPEIEDVYHKINSGLWQALEEGEITREQLMETRFGKTFEHFGRHVNGRELDAEYRSYLAGSKVFVEGALEVIQALSPNYELYITSNGISDTQNKRLEVTGLAPYFKQVFVSEDTGYQKPMKPFFDFVFERIPNFDPTKAMIIGDSYSADITGGAGAGIDTCWLNPHKKPKKAVQPTYTIEKIAQLVPILNNSKINLKK
ncbi:noncanonical pyrimidine nucleotidase, YjjG family [Lysinibacillus sp. 2017]|uniref:YjjG family noncanonical pyrimidine nucleotidase n=1 Tax=unclassified Lysinibacillus TaxID=2636778 RepID=UPI000D52723A|nr:MULTISPECIES: YjjG family noncanonical pyrimidine nucleotidase [unclassified Lysinibacillus]AWE09331.1 noncanonical pyrimidine nucleotidase, YjjG family [Lysinibacillus sp. 2017]TGN35507.1 noncanonical pyrimidine nucleotidase, YjjG family [Lysinibacillus sp. S2017]